MMLSTPDTEYLCRLVADRSSIALTPEQSYLFTSRLLPVAKQAGLPGLGELVSQLRMRPYGPLHRSVIDAMTTNETSFFRDAHPFETLRQQVLPELIARRAASRRLRIWSAASSSGQEAISCAIVLREHFPQLAGWTVEILGTDLSPTMVARARGGVYTQLEIGRGVPARCLVKYFASEGVNWRVDRSIHAMVEWRELNLAEPWPILPTFDLVLLRNVLIYFPVDVRAQILARTQRVLASDGYLMLGSGETTLGVSHAFTVVEGTKSSLYRPVTERPHADHHHQ